MVTFALTTSDILEFILSSIGIGYYFWTKIKGHKFRTRLDEYFCLLLFGIIFGLSVVFLNLIRFNQDRYSDLMALLIFGPWMIMPLYTAGATFVAKVIGVFPIFNANRDRYIAQIQDPNIGMSHFHFKTPQTNNEINPENQQKITAKLDLRRKGMHMFFSIMIFSITLIAAELTRLLQPFITDQNFLSMFWEIQETFYFLNLWTHPNQTYMIGRLHLPLFFTGYIGTVISMWLDMLRFSDRWWIPARNTVLHFSRKKELDRMPSFVPFFLAICFVSVFLPPIPIFGIMIVMIFADAAASQFGIRFGRHHIPWIPKKTWEGTIAGTIVALLSIIFVGWIWGLIAMGIFLLIDLVTDHPIEISDNILIPTILCIIFLILEIYGFHYAIPYWLVTI